MRHRFRPTSRHAKRATERNVRMAIVIGTPTYNETVCTNYLHALLATAGELKARKMGWELITGSSSLITLARNQLVADFLDRPTATHLLFWDSDVAVAPTTL